jgi:hypothetical protein
MRAVLRVVISLALGFALAELVLTVIRFPFDASKTPSETRIARFDADLGWSYVPRSSSTQSFGHAKRKVVLAFDRIGARCNDPERVLDGLRPTLLFIGDSFTMGHGVSYDECVSGIVERAIGSRFQVINLGVQAFGSDQAYLMLLRHISSFNVKAVVYTFIAEHVQRNAVSDRRLMFRYRRYQFVGTKPAFGLEHGALRLADAPMRYEDMSSSSLLALTKMAYIAWCEPPAIELTRQIVIAMNNTVQDHGAALVVVHWDQARNPSQYGDQVLGGLGMNVLDTRDAPPEGWTSWKIPGDGHPTPQAHEHVAKLLLERLRGLGIE